MEQERDKWALEPGHDPWALEHEDSTGEEGYKPEFTPKAHLVLEGSEQHPWGIVKDCHGSINIITDDAEVVGMWNRYGDGVIWVDLTTPLEALRDKAVQLYKELSDARLDTMARLGISGQVKKAPRTPRAPKEPKEEPPKNEALDRIRSLFSK